MKILAFDTSFGATSVAVRWSEAAGERRLAEAQQGEPLRQRGQAERLIPMLKEVMATTGLAFHELDRIAVTTGPGTFTGVRIGVAAARALALASGVPTVGVSSLAVMAHQAHERLGASRRQRLLAVAVDARRDSVFIQLFPHRHHPVGPPQLLALPAAAQCLLALAEGDPIIVGSGARRVLRALTSAGGQGEASLPDLLPAARALASLACELAPTQSLQPNYLRPPDVKPPDPAALARILP
jgi:tRNA threonylcarbamoyladenosine biosynthesis protein TsaB